MATGTGVGSTIITATSGNISGSVTVTVTNNSLGNNWALKSFGYALGSFAWSGKLFVGVGEGGRILTPSDGVTWTIQYDAAEGDYLTAVVWSGTQFIAVGGALYSRQSPILTSPDGVSWTAQTSGTTAELYGVAWSGTQFVAVGSMGIILTSPGGVTWTAQTSGTESHLNDVTWSGTQFVAVGSGGVILDPAAVLAVAEEVQQ